MIKPVYYEKESKYHQTAPLSCPPSIILGRMLLIKSCCPRQTFTLLLLSKVKELCTPIDCSYQTYLLILTCQKFFFNTFPLRIMYSTVLNISYISHVYYILMINTSETPVVWLYMAYNAISYKRNYKKCINVIIACKVKSVKSSLSIIYC